MGFKISGASGAHDRRTDEDDLGKNVGEVNRVILEANS